MLNWEKTILPLLPVPRETMPALLANLSPITFKTNRGRSHGNRSSSKSRCTRATYESCTSDQPNNELVERPSLFYTRWNGFVACSSNIVMKQTTNHQVVGSADCRVDSFEMNRTRRIKFITNIWSTNKNNVTCCVNLRNCYINYKIWAVHTLYIHGIDVINSILKNLG